jgi:hypothetical protein
MNMKRSIISIAIALVLAFFVGYGIEVFDPSPRNEDFCPRNLYEINNQEECEESSGYWNEPDSVDGRPSPNMCSPGKRCYEDFDLARSKHDKIVFIAALIIGLTAIIVGVILKKAAVNTGVIAGGVLLLLYGTIRYWQHAQNVLKFCLLGVALAVLIWLGYKKLDSK